MAKELDLHMHSSISIDGEYSPAELMQLCRARGLKTVALTDHNTMEGIAEAREAAEALGLELIPGIELDCQFQGVNVHLLGYGIQPSQGLAAYGQDLIEQEQAASSVRIRLVQELGISLDVDQVRALSRQGIVTGEVIAEVALGDKRNLHNPLLAPYREGGARSDNPYVNFYWDTCAQGKPAYVPVEFISLAEAVRLVKEAGGFPVLAHPGINIGVNGDLLRGIVGCGVEGIEVYSSYHDAATVAYYKAQAEAYNLLKTLGSDFHGKTKPAVQLGGIDCPEEAAISAGIRRALGSR